ncbi:hypothetical protein PMIT1303_01539 [Prochlorococcus sp. MIT 1303]|nr:hypothetical protein PMIT1303_01539 [Prochlorococcus sp. MIT 1303]
MSSSESTWERALSIVPCEAFSSPTQFLNTASPLDVSNVALNTRGQGVTPRPAMAETAHPWTWSPDSRKRADRDPPMTLQELQGQSVPRT